MSKEKTIYDLKLHESMTVDYYEITRVPGGWLYYRAQTNTSYGGFRQEVTNVFVPYDKEFQEA